MVKKNGLGKGLEGLGVDALIPSSKVPVRKKTADDENKKAEEKKVTEENEDNVSRETLVKVSMIQPNKNQPRKNFDEDALQELAESIKKVGIIQPLVLQKKDKYYEIIAGERRWRASVLAGLKEVPAIIKEYSEKEVIEIALIENIQREDLNPIEEASAYQRLIKEFGLKQDELAERVSKSRVTITNSMRLLKLDKRVQEMLIDMMITSGHARAILPIEDKDYQYNLAMKIFDERLSVREVEKLVRIYLENKEKPEKTQGEQIDENFAVQIENMEETLKNSFGTKVSIKAKSNNKGKIEIEYYSVEDLERIYDMLNR